jgi:hypothetical protein
MKRHRNFNFKCRKCKLSELKEQERLVKEAEDVERFRLMARHQEGEQLFRGYGKYFLKPFRIVAEDIPFVTRLLNLPKEKVYEENLIAFLSYVSSCYEIADVEVVG